jgi:Zn-finger nucleic acid-binding protein
MLTENLAGHSCGKCLGTLVSLVAYRAWRDHAARATLADAGTATMEVEAPDSIGAKKCPKCRSVMSKYRFSSAQANRLDYCPHCEEVWLDDGEWQLVESLVNTGELTRIFTQAWQYAIRTEASSAMEERRLRELLGADYERVAGFAEWLQSQPAKQEILAKLSRIPRR